MSITQTMVLRASAAKTGAGTDTGTAQKIQQKVSEAVFVLDVTAAATDVGDTLDVFIDTSYDGGTTWLNVAKFTQSLGNGSTKKYYMFHKPNPLASSNVVLSSAEQTAGNVLQVPLGDNLRYRGVVAESSTVNSAFTYSVSAFLKA